MLAWLVLTALWVLLVLLAHRVQPERMERLAHKALPALLVLGAILALLVPLLLLAETVLPTSNNSPARTQTVYESPAPTARPV